MRTRALIAVLVSLTLLVAALFLRRGIPHPTVSEPIGCAGDESWLSHPVPDALRSAAEHEGLKELKHPSLECTAWTFQVHDSERNPIANAFVYACAEQNVQRAETGRDGRCTLQIGDSARVIVLAQAEGWYHAGASLADPGEHEIVMSPTRSFSVRITTEDGGALSASQASFRARRATWPVNLVGHSNGGGTHTFNSVPVGVELLLTASAPGYATIERAYVLELGGEDDHVVSLRSAVALFGGVVDSLTGEPITEAVVEFPEFGWRSTTSAQGEFHLGDRMPAGQAAARIVVWARGYCELSGPVLARASEPFTVELPRAATVLGRVIDAHGQAVPGARLSCSSGKAEVGMPGWSGRAGAV